MKVSIKDIEKIFEIFKSTNPAPATELHYSNTYELLVAVILSAQCTDKRVNMVTPALFNAFPTIFDMAKATPEMVFTYIKSISYPNNKANNLVKMAKQVTENYAGKIPDTTTELIKLPGVGQKTANVIVSVAFGQDALAVDTHVFRVGKRLGLHSANTPEKAELQLIKIIPKKYLSNAHHWLILHGRYICTAKNPKCEQCLIKTYCNYYQQHSSINNKNQKPWQKNLNQKKASAKKQPSPQRKKLVQKKA